MTINGRSVLITLVVFESNKKESEVKEMINTTFNMLDMKQNMNHEITSVCRPI